jgi:hypothetical protein
MTIPINRDCNTCDQINNNIQQSDLINVRFTIYINNQVNQKQELFMTISVDNGINDIYVFLLNVFQYLSERQLIYLYSIDMAYVNEMNTPEFVKNRDGYFHFNSAADSKILI